MPNILVQTYSVITLTNANTGMAVFESDELYIQIAKVPTSAPVIPTLGRFTGPTGTALRSIEMNSYINVTWEVAVQFVNASLSSPKYIRVTVVSSE